MRRRWTPATAITIIKSMPEIVELILEMRHVAEFVREAREAAGATEQVGKAAEKSGKQAEKGFRGVAKWAGAGVMLYASTKAIRSVSEANVQLAKSTLGVQRVTNMDTKTASEWVGVMNERGISVSNFQVAMKTLSKVMVGSRDSTAKEAKGVALLRQQIDRAMTAGGPDAAKKIAKFSSAITTLQGRGAKSRAALDKLGVSMAAVRRGDTNEVLMEIADGMKGLRDPTERVALAQQLLGRSGIRLLPLLMKGRDGIREQLSIQEAYGNYLTGHGIKDTQAFIERQRELTAAFEGAKVQLGTALQPALTSLAGAITDVSRALAPLFRNATAMRLLIYGVATAFIAWKVASVGAAIANMEFSASMLVLTGVIGAVVIGVAALVVGIVYLYRHWKPFHDLVQTSWKWIKTHWPLLLGILLGPIGLAVVEMIRHWGKVKKVAIDTWHAIVGAAQSAWDWIRGHWKLLVAILIGPIATAAYLIASHWKTILRGAAHVWQWIEEKWGKITHWLVRPVEAAVDRIVGLVKSIPGRIGHGVFGMFGKLGKLGGLAHRFHIPGAADGGIVQRAGSVLIGERGPEVLTLPAAARVAPLPPTAVAAFAGAGAAGSFRPLEVVVPVYLDGRELARSVARVTANQLARR